MDALGIANQALALVGENPISSFDEGTPAAWGVRAFFPTVIDEVTGEYSWSFATARATLTAASGPNNTPYQYQYDRPVDALKIIRASGGSQILNEGAVVYSDSDRLSIVYVRSVCDVSDPSSPAIAAGVVLPPRFVAVVAYLLATRVALTLPNGAEIAQFSDSKYQQLLQAAKAADAAASIRLDPIGEEAVNMVGEQANLVVATTPGAIDAAVRGYKSVIDEVTGEFPWTFARARGALVENTEVENTTAYALAYDLPDGLIEVVSLDGGHQYEIIGSHLYTDAGGVVATYTQSLVDATNAEAPRIRADVSIPAKFQHVCAIRLAMRVLASVAGPTNVWHAMENQYAYHLNMAKAADARRSPGNDPVVERWEEVQ